jgi:hypothetical protein
MRRIKYLRALWARHLEATKADQPLTSRFTTPLPGLMLRLPIVGLRGALTADLAGSHQW